MNNYDPQFLLILAPLIIVQSPDLPILTRQFQKINVHGQIWDNCILKNRLLINKYLINIVDEDFKLDHISKSESQHSILSPFNVDSELFPNGILSVDWFTKYLSNKPFAYVCVVELSINPEDDEILASKILALKNACVKSDIKFISIVVSNSQANNDEDRINQLRQLTSLGRSLGLIYLNYQLETIERDCEVLVSNLAANLRTVAVEFYNKIETKIKHRNTKYYTIPSSTNVDTTIELTPKFLDTRNLIKQAIISQFSHSHNLDSCLKYLETAYGQLVELIRDNFFVFTKDRISPHDLKLHTQWRTLCDIVAFHIVRIYLSLEDRIVAIKKHQTHILNVVDAVNGRIDLSQWILVQYEWLCELLCLVPKLIVSNNIKKPTTISFFGGLKFVDEKFEIITDPYLILVKAVDSLAKFKHSHQLDFLSNVSDIKSKKLKLLHRALELSENSDYVYYRLAEEYFSQGQFKNAVEFYTKLGTKASDFIGDYILERLCVAYGQLKNYDDQLIVILKLCTTNCRSHGILKTITFDSTKVDTLDYNGDMLKISVVYLGENSINGIEKESMVYDKIITQLKIDGNIDINILQKYLNQPITVTVLKVMIFYTNGDQFVLKHDDDCGIVDIIKNTSQANLKLCKQLIIEYHQTIEKSGIYNIEKIEIELTMNINHIKIINKQSFNNNDVQPFIWYYKSLNNDIVKVPIKLKSPFTNNVKINPPNPNTVVELKTSLNSIVIGEKITLKFNIKFNKDRKLNHVKVSLSPRIKIQQADGGENSIDSKVNWKGLKDDEALALNNFDSAEEISAELNLSIFTTTLQDKTLQTSTKVTLDLNTLVVEDDNDDNMVIYNLANYEIPILNQPFASKFTISPKYRGVQDMPNPFILHEQHLSMPIVTRVWQGNLSLNNAEDIKVDDIKFVIESKSPEIAVDILQQSHSKQLFSTKSKNGISQRNITMVVSANIQWSRENINIANTYTTQPWEIVLPLTDPRVLLTIEPQSENTVRFKYIIENPTPRIFVFQTKLFDDNERFIWHFEPKDNMYPLTITKFPVLPFNDFIIEYIGSFNSMDKLVQLPQMKVFDLQYKVVLPILPVSPNLVINGGKLFYNASLVKGFIV